MGDQVAMTADVTMADAAPVLEIAKGVGNEHEDNGNGNGNAVSLLDGQVQPHVIVEDLIVEDVIGQYLHSLADNCAESC
jgi:hypothetical protein